MFRLKGNSTHVQKLRDNREMASEVAFCALWYAFAALHGELASMPKAVQEELTYPGDQDVLGQ